MIWNGLRHTQLMEYFRNGIKPSIPGKGRARVGQEPICNRTNVSGRGKAAATACLCTISFRSTSLVFSTSNLRTFLQSLICLCLARRHSPLRPALLNQGVHSPKLLDFQIAMVLLETDRFVLHLAHALSAGVALAMPFKRSIPMQAMNSLSYRILRWDVPIKILSHNNQEFEYFRPF